MNRIFLLPLLALLGLSLGACQKEASEAERKAEIERQVQERLAAEHQAQQAQELGQRQADLAARERALAEKENHRVRPETQTPFATATAKPQTESETDTYATFYRRLDPYGDWMETSDYGYVFQPRAATVTNDWRPYTNGHWVYTDAGWTWISDEPFGWATYHYGRWIRLRNVGWVWVPGQQWAPAWVSWRKGNDYVGWAPLPPEAQFDRQTGIRNWVDNYYDIGPEQYAFVPATEFGRKLTPREILPLQRNLTIINQTTNVTNITYNDSIVVDRGPSYDDLRARSSQPIERLRLERTRTLTEEKPVIRGQVVALPTIDFQERNARPNRVSRNIGQPVAERGWNGIQDGEATRKAREKMKAEATPPPNLPAKRFVSPNDRPANPTRPTPVKAATATPAATVAPALSPRPARPAARPQATATPSVPTAPNERPKLPARPAVTPAPQPSATPGDVVQPSPAENVVFPKETDRNRGKPERDEREQKRKEQMAKQAQRRAERAQKMQERRANKSAQPEESPAAPSAAQPGASPTPAESPNDKPDRPHKGRRAQERREQAESSPSPTAP